MHLRPDFRVLVQEVVQYMKQRFDVRAVVARLGMSNVIDDHSQDHLRTARLVAKIVRHGCRGGLGQVFMLGNSEYFFLREAAETNTVVQADHGAIPTKYVQLSLISINRP